ncbi:MAG: hypothetical protein HZB76_03480 [Chlamydiae bacterium]|nr:hypothetical protein [Chlamydiota bacterium]
MSQDFYFDEKKEITELLKKQKLSCVEKRPLRDILSSYWKEKIDEDLLKKIRDEFVKVKTDMNEASNTFVSIMDIQKKLVQIYEDLQMKNKK